AYAAAAICYVRRQSSGWMADRSKEVAEAARLARAAVALGKDDATVLARAGHVLTDVAHEFEAGRLFIERALALNPNSSNAWHLSGWQMVYAGDPETAIRHFAQFKRLSPRDPLMPLALSGSAFAHFFAGRYDEACALAEQVLQESPDLHQALRIFIVSHVAAGHIDQAQTALSRLFRIDPTLRVSNLANMTPLCRPEDIASYHDGMRQAGLPE